MRNFLLATVAATSLLGAGIPAANSMQDELDISADVVHGIVVVTQSDLSFGEVDVLASSTAQWLVTLDTNGDLEASNEATYGETGSGGVVQVTGLVDGATYNATINPVTLSGPGSQTLLYTPQCAWDGGANSGLNDPAVCSVVGGVSGEGFIRVGGRIQANFAQVTEEGTYSGTTAVVVVRQ